MGAGTIIRYLSLFSGIEAWSCAIRDIPAYKPVAFCEIDPFASAVLQYHYPNVKNLGDITKVDWSKYRGSIDLIVGGSPCQGFSQAGYRKGLRDSRSSLALSYVQAVECVQPRWLLWENVPGVLSTNDGADFRAFLAALDDLGYGLAWTVLDSQWFGVAQRRRRVFVVGSLGSWECAAKVLFEPSCLQRNPPPRRQAGKGDSGSSKAGAGDGRVSGTLCSSGAGLDRPSASGNQLDFLVESYAVRTAQTGANGIDIAKGSAHTLDSADVQAVAAPQREREREQKAYQIANGTARPAEVSCTLDVRCRNGAMQDQAAIAVVAGPSTSRATMTEAKTVLRPSRCAPITAERSLSPHPAVAGTVTAKWAKGTGGPSGNECQNLVLVEDAR